jgi:hypothetical protein
MCPLFAFFWADPLCWRARFEAKMRTLGGRHSAEGIPFLADCSGCLGAEGMKANEKSRQRRDGDATRAIIDDIARADVIDLGSIGRACR